MASKTAQENSDRRNQPLEPSAPRDGAENEISWLHRFAALVSVLAFLAIVSGSLGTNTPAYARLAGTAGDGAALAAALVALWLWRSSSALHVKTLGFLAAALGVAAAFAASRASAAAAPMGVLCPSLVTQGFFGLSVPVALFTRTDWRWDEAKTPDLAAPSFRNLSALTAAMIFLDSLLGTAYGAKAARLAPHLILGVAAATGALWMLEMALNKFSSLRELKIAAVLTTELVVLQLFIGLVSYSMELNARATLRPLPGLAVIAAAHAALGALTVAASLFAMFEAFKYLAPRSKPA